MEETSFVTFLSIKILLTEKGLREHKSILSVVFGYLSLLSDEGGLRSYYDELAEIEHTCFRFQQKSNSTTYVTNVATTMAVKPLQFILNHLPFRDFNYPAILSLLNYITPSNAIGFLCTNESFLEECATDIEPVYGVHYGLLPFRRMRVTAIRPSHRCLAGRTCRRSPSPLSEPVHLHAVRHAAGCVGKPPSGSGRCRASPRPQIINEPSLKVWYSCCTEFKQPYCGLTVLLNSGLFLESVENALLTALLVK